MKRARFLITTIAAVTLATFNFTACEKTPDQKTGKPESAEPAKPADAPQPASASTKPAPAPAPAVTAADVAKAASAYGFVAKLPADVDGFDASLRLHELWSGLANSKWAATLLDLPPLKSHPGFASFREQWNSPQGEQIREILAEVLGNEFVVAMPSGFGEQLKPWMEVLTIYQAAILEGQLMSAFSGSPMTPQKMQQMFRDAAPEFVPALAKCDAPSLMFVSKAGKIRPLVDEATKKLVSMVGVELPPAFETASFKVDDKYDFQSISVTAKKLIAQFQEVQLELQLKELLGDEAEVKKAMDAIAGKRFELAWGWVDDYFVVSTGKDHSHVKFAASETASVLANPAVAARAAQYLDKKPMGLSYVSKRVFDALGTDLEFAGDFKSIAEELAGILKEEQIAAMVEDVRKLEKRAQDIFKTDYSDQVSVTWWEAGIRAESFGGANSHTLDSSKPLAFTNLVSPGTFLFIGGRSDHAQSKATTDFIEDAAATLWNWYEKYGRTMVPEGERQGAAMIEATAIPMLKDFWKASRKLGAALGDESAFIFDTVGTVPKIPDMPPFLAEGKLPRLAYVIELKDRAGVSAAWNSYSGLIKQIIALVGGDQGGPQIPEPQMKKEGDTEIHSLPLPLDTGDLLPHIAISKDRWILGTSPSLSAELAAKPANTAGPALGADIQLNFTALYDHAEAWLAVVSKNADAIMGANAQEFQSAKPLIDTGLKLARSLQGLEVKLFEEGGTPRMSLHLKLQDVK